MKTNRFKKILPVFILLILAFGCRQKLPPPADLPTSCIVVYGDSRTHHSKHKKIVADILQTKPVAVFHTGDLVHDADSRKQWKKAADIIAPLRAVTDFFPVRGNHDKDTPLFFEYFHPPGDKTWYSVDRLGIHFIVLDTNEDLSDTSVQVRWLINDLRNVPDSTHFIAALFHIPLYTTGLNKPSTKFRHVLTPIFETYGVNIVFNGHNHLYERLRVNGIYYVVTGGGGAPLYRQTRSSPYSQKVFRGYHFCTVENAGTELVVSAYDIKRRLIDRFTVPSRRPANHTAGSGSSR